MDNSILSWKRINDSKYTDLLATDQWKLGSTVDSVFTDHTFNKYNGANAPIVKYQTPFGTDDLAIFHPWAASGS